MTEQQLLIDCLKRLNQIGIPYMLTGSMVSNYWGIPRTTHDLDFVVQIPEAVISKLVSSFAHSFHIDEAAVRAAFQPPFQFNAIDLRSSLKVDFWILQPRPFEMMMFERKIKIRLFGETAWIATAEDIILHKLSWHRMNPSERQLGDAAGVVAVQGPALDLAYLQHWATELKVQELLSDLLAGRIKPKST